MQTELTPAESWVVWMGQDADARHAVKVTLISLIAQGYVRVGEIHMPGVFGPKVRQGMSTTGKSLSDAPSHVSTALAAVRAAETSGNRDMAQLVKTLGEFFGAGYYRFLHELVLPRLEARSLIRLVPRKKFLGLFQRAPLMERTPAGEAERERIAARLRDAGEIKSLLRTDPARAAAMAIALGGLVYLASELWPVYGALGDAIRRHSQAGDAGLADSGGGGGGEPSREPAFEGFDTAALDGLDSTMTSFDSGFDAAADAGGGDGGGGDGGGGGGD